MAYGILCDREIEALCAGDHAMLHPFVARQEGKPSYGLGSFGYDLRLGRRILVSRGAANAVLDPLEFPEGCFQTFDVEKAFELAPNSQVLGESVERFQMPDDVCGACWGKSSYARCGLLVNVTPLEPGWHGVLTIALANVSPMPIRLHVGQGIAQVVFFRGTRPRRTYGEKEAGGGYQDQSGVTLPH